MRIAYLTHQYFPHHVGGTEVYTRGLATRAVDAGHDVRIITYHESSSGDPADHGIHRQIHDGIPIIELHSNLGSTRNPIRYEYANPVTAQWLRSELQQFQPDLVHVMHAMKLSGSCLEVCSQMRIPFLVTLCDFWFLCPRHTLLTWDDQLCRGPKSVTACRTCVRHTHDFARQGRLGEHRSLVSRFRTGLRSLKQRLREIRALRQRSHSLKNVLLQAERIIALTEFQKQMFIENGYPDSIEIIPHGLDVDGLTRDKSRPQRTPVRCIFIGTFAAHKGPHILIEALKRIPQVQVEVSLYGKLRDNSYCRKLQSAAHEDHRIRFMGTFPPEQFGSILNDADVLLMPAMWYENGPLVVKAARYSGLPVMAAKIGSLTEMVRHEVDGWLVAPGDVQAWANAIQQAASHPLLPLPASQVKTLHENAKEMFSLYDQVLQQYPTQ